MPPFEFPLRRALQWRRTQLELEEAKLRQLVAAVEELRLAAVRLDLAKNRAEQSVCVAQTVEAGDLWALAAYRQRLIAEKQALAVRRRACQQEADAQRQRVVGAQRQCRLLEKLEERRRAEWQRDQDREIETLASESYLARWNRRPDRA
jgi:hypothetical protein